MKSVADALSRLEIFEGIDYDEQWQAIQEIQHFLDGKKEDLDGIAGETLYPTTVDIPTEKLASKIAEYCEELYERRKEALERDAMAVTAIWPDIAKALRVAGMNAPFCKQPMMSPDNTILGLSLSQNGAPYSVSKKAEAIESAKKYGADGWFTVPDYIQWLHGGGPIFEKAMERYGYSPHKGVKGRFS